MFEIGNIACLFSLDTLDLSHNNITFIGNKGNNKITELRTILVLFAYLGFHKNVDSQIPARSIILNISTMQSIFNIPLECVHMCLSNILDWSIKIKCSRQQEMAVQQYTETNTIHFHIYDYITEPVFLTEYQAMCVTFLQNWWCLSNILDWSIKIKCSRQHTSPLILWTRTR
jgi:hypothetical protein